MKTSLLITLVLTLTSLTTHAKTSILQRILVEYGFIADPGVMICSEDMKIDYQASELELWNSAQKAANGYDKCKPAAFYKSLIVNHPTSPRYKEAYRNYIKTFFDAGDYIMTMNEANQYIEQNKGLNDSEYMHLLLLRAVAGEIKQVWREKDRQMEFVALSLGASLTQTEESPYLMNLKYRQFLDRYPHSPWKNEVLAMLNESRQMYGQNVLSEARLFIMKGDYPSAFNKYNVVLQWGPVVQVFEEALYEMIEYQLQLSWILTSNQLLNDLQLNRLLKRDLSVRSTPEERTLLANQTHQQALKYLEQMKTNLPNSPWTSKALKLASAF